MKLAAFSFSIEVWLARLVNHFVVLGSRDHQDLHFIILFKAKNLKPEKHETGKQSIDLRHYLVY